jgi:hypothetical protein
MVRLAGKEKAMNTLSPNKTGIVLGTLMGGWHLVWAILVAAGWAQLTINFVFWMHFIVPPYTVKPFQASVAVVLIAVTATLGYAIAYLFAVLWNWLRR